MSKIEIKSDGNNLVQKIEIGLGRLYSKDERDHNFPMRALLPKKALDKPRAYRYHNASGWWGDQGDSPHCVGYSLAHFIEDGPVTHSGTAPIVNPVDIYRRAQDIDEWPGTDYDGTSVRAGMKALQEKGFIKEYRWMWTIDEIIACLSAIGPVPVGTVWTYDMFFPNAKGVVRPTGHEAGGHAYLINGYNLKTRLFRFKNSWGRLWGDDGHGWISFDDFKILLDNYGEAAFAIEQKPSK